MEVAQLEKAIKLRDKIKNLGELKNAIESAKEQKETPRAIFLKIINEWHNVSSSITKDIYLMAALNLMMEEINKHTIDLLKQFDEL